MKLAILSPFPRPGESALGGIQIAAVRLVEALEGQGVDLTVLPLHAGSRTAGPLPTTDSRFLGLRNLRPIRSAFRELIRDAGFDIVHALGAVPAGYVATHAQLDGAACVVTAHGNRREDTLAGYSGVGAWARWLIGRRMAVNAASRADVVVGVHPDWAINLPAPPARFVYIPNVIDNAFFAATRAPEPGRVLFCGGVARIKGLDLLLSSWPSVVQRVPEARLHAVGCLSGAHVFSPRIRSSVEIDDWLGQSDLVDAMARASVVVVPSHYDVAPTIIGEAWAARTPIVATAVGGIPTLAGGAARVVQPDAAALADGLVRALTEPDEGLVEEGSRRAELQRRDAVAVAHVKLYESLAADR